MKLPRSAKPDTASDEGVTPAQAKEYFAAARAWNMDRISRADTLIRGQRWVIGTLTLICAGLTGALLILVPLKRVEPYVVRVDTSTGIVDNVVRLADSKRSPEESVTRYFIRRYVGLRENYSRNQIELAFKDLELLTDKRLRYELRKEFEFATPTSMYRTFGQLGTREVTVKSLSRISETIFQVRFFATEKINGIERVLHYVSTIEYQYQGSPQKETTLAVNPLGFVVTAYRRDVEALPTEQGS